MKINMFSFSNVRCYREDKLFLKKELKAFDFHQLEENWEESSNSS